MTQKVSHSEPRKPVFIGGRRVPTLYQRTRSDGTIVFDARPRMAGVRQWVTLDARTKMAAVEELNGLKVDRRRGDPVRSSSLVPTVSEVAADWLSHLELLVHHRDPKKRRSPRTVALYRQRMEAHVLPTLGRLPIDELSAAHLRRLVDKLGGKLAPSTLTSAINMTSALCRYARKQGLIERNPVRDLDRDDRPGVSRQSEPRYLSTEEVARLLEKMTDSFRPVAATCAYGGFRISEALGLTWADVDFTTKQLHVHRQLDDDLTIRGTTKTRASTGAVPLLPALERELKAHRSRQAAIGLHLVKPDKLIFTTWNGKPQSRRNALRAVHAAGYAIGLNGKGLESVGLHDLRHSFVALALDSGATMAEAAVLARHANAKVTGQVYAGLNEKAKAQIATKLTDAGFGS